MTRAFTILFLLCILVVDCSHVYVDHGTCGNACCKIIYELSVPTKEAASAIKTELLKNQEYRPELMNDGNYGFSDYSKYDIGVDYIAKWNHEMPGPKHYNDSIYFTIKPLVSDSAKSRIEIFSISLIGGAYGDGEGQNYKNIQNFMMELNQIIVNESIEFGCGKPPLPLSECSKN